MSRESKLVKNTFIITVGKICTQLITFFLLPLYTAVLSTEEYGTVDLLNILVSLLLPVVTFQIEQFGISYKFINNEYKVFLATNVVVYIYASLFLQIARGLGDNKKYALGSFLSAFTTIIFNILFLVVIKLGVSRNATG